MPQKKYYTLNALNAVTKHIGEHLNSSDSSYAFQHERFFQDEREVDVSSIYGIIFLPKNKQDEEFHTNVTKLGILKVVQKCAIRKAVLLSQTQKALCQIDI